MGPGQTTTPAIDLRLINAGDRGLYHALYSSPEVMLTVGSPLASGEIDAQFARVLRHNLLEFPGHRAWAIDAANSSEQFGLTALLRDGPRAEFGIMLLPHAWRRGIASSAVRTLLPLAFDALRLGSVDVSRTDDAQAVVMNRLLSPFGFERAAGLRPGEVGWVLHSRTWMESARA